MPAGVAASLRKVQLGVETTWGTAVAATALMGGVTDVKLRRKRELVPVRDLGRMGPGSQVLMRKSWVEGTIEFIPSYEDLMYPLHGLFGTPSTTGAGDPYTHPYVAPLTAVPTAKFFSGELGAASNAYLATSLVFTDLKLSGSAGDIWKGTANFFAKSAATVSLASLNDRAYEGIRVADTVLSVDAVGGTMGATAVPSSLLNFEFGIMTGRKPIFAAGSLGPVDYAEGEWGTSLKTSLRFITASKAYIDATLGDATLLKQIELKATSGSHIARLQTAVFMDGDYNLHDVQDDELTVDLNWKGLYNTTFGNYLKAQLLNAVATLV